MATCLFRFVFDIYLAIPDGSGFVSEANGEEVFISCQAQSGERIFSYVSNNYSWLTEGDAIWYQALSTNQVVKLPARKFAFFKKKDYLSGGFIDNVKYTIISFYFKTNNLGQFEDENYLNEKRDWALGVIKNFVDLYLFISGVTTVNRSSFDDIPIVEFYVNDDNLDFKQPINHDFRPHKGTTITTVDPHKKGYGRKLISQNQITMLADYFSKGMYPKIYDRLLLDAKEQAHIQHNYDLCVILSETAFEVYIQQLLLELCEIKKIKLLPVGRGKAVTQKDYRVAILNGNIREVLICKYLKHLTRKNFTESKIYSKWLTEVFTKRNDIIHKGQFNTDNEGAELAFNTVIAFITEIQDYVQAQAHLDIV